MAPRTLTLILLCAGAALTGCVQQGGYGAAGQDRRKSAMLAERNLTPSQRLIAACARGDDAAAGSLLDAGADVSARDARGWTPLRAAVYEGRLSTIGVLLSRGADVNEADQLGGSVLHLAAGRGNVAAIQALLAHGANVNAKDNIGDTPLVTAAMLNHVEAVEALRKAGGRGEVPSGRVGISFNENAGRFVVIGAVPGSPADQAGIRKGDEILTVGGESVQGLDRAAVVGKMRGSQGTRLRITIQRPGSYEPQEFVIVREAVQTAAKPAAEETPWWREKD